MPVVAIGPVLVIVLVLSLVAALPVWPHSRGWSLRPLRVIAVLLVAVLLLRWIVKF